MPNGDLPEAIGPYRPLEQIGVGGFGTVYLVRERGRLLAAKVLDARLSGVDGTALKRRLEREVETMRRVRSRYVAEVVDCDLDADPPYLVTRYVEGLPLRDLVADEGPLRYAALLRLATGLAEAVRAIHAADCVHRDLKPSNVMMVDGDPVVIDFGVAHDVEATRLTRDGATGTPGYMAPELLMGGTAGPPVDVFGWAATVVFAATGRRAFPGESEQATNWRITAGQPDLDGIPGELAALLRDSLAVDPVARPDAPVLLARLGKLVPRRGADRRVRVEISLEEADTGTSHHLPDGQVVDIPAGHTVVRLGGRGEPGLHGGPSGDLLAEVEVRTDQDVERRGADLHTRRRIPYRLAADGGPLQFPVAARDITLSVPAGVSSGRVIQVPGGGLPRPDGPGRGDLYVELDVAPAPDDAEIDVPAWLHETTTEPPARRAATARRKGDHLAAAPVSSSSSGLLDEYGAFIGIGLAVLLVIGLPVGLINYDGRRSLLDTAVTGDPVPKIWRDHDWTGTTTTVQLKYPIVLGRDYSTTFRSGNGNTRYLHTTFRLTDVKGGCEPLSVTYTLRLQNGSTIATGTLTRLSAPKTVGYAKVGAAPVLTLTVQPATSVPAGCTANLAVQNPYLHSLPRWLSYFAMRDSPTRGRAK